MLASDLVGRGNGTKSVTFAWSPDGKQRNESYIMCFQFVDEARLELHYLVAHHLLMHFLNLL